MSDAAALGMGPAQGAGGNATFGPLRDWPRVLQQALQRDEAVARIVVASGKGSVPRDAGVCMLVGADWCRGTIGGGMLEWQGILAARALLADGAVPARLDRRVLAADLGQCCGGVVELWLERFERADLPLLARLVAAVERGPAVLASTLAQGELQRRLVTGAGAGVADSAQGRLLQAHPSRAQSSVTLEGSGAVQLLERLDDPLPAVWLYGAGHVGQALAALLAQLPVRLTWIDARGALLPRELADATVWAAPDPVATVAAAPAGAHFIVMTHSHALDYALARAILAREDFASAGLIGSDSKAARFRSRLRKDGLSDGRIARLRCPIGVAGIASKWPAAIAVSVAAQLLQDPGIAAADTLPEGKAMASDAQCAGTACQSCQKAPPEAAPRLPATATQE